MADNVEVDWNEVGQGQGQGQGLHFEGTEGTGYTLYPDGRYRCGCCGSQLARHSAEEQYFCTNGLGLKCPDCVKSARAADKHQPLGRSGDK